MGFNREEFDSFKYFSRMFYFNQNGKLQFRGGGGGGGGT